MKGLAQVGCLRARELNNGDYRVEIGGGLKGGGAGGAAIGFQIGKWGTWAAGHGTIVFASVMTGPAFFATFASLEAQFAAPIEATSNTVGLGTGVLGGVLTGPA